MRRWASLAACLWLAFLSPARAQTIRGAVAPAGRVATAAPPSGNPAVPLLPSPLIQGRPPTVAPPAPGTPALRLAPRASAAVQPLAASFTSLLEARRASAEREWRKAQELFDGIGRAPEGAGLDPWEAPLGQRFHEAIIAQGTPRDIAAIHGAADRILETPTGRQLAGAFVALGGRAPVGLNYYDSSDIVKRKGFEEVVGVGGMRYANGSIGLNRLWLDIDPDLSKLASTLAHELLGHGLASAAALYAVDREASSAVVHHKDNERFARIVGWLVSAELRSPLLAGGYSFLNGPRKYWRMMETLAGVYARTVDGVSAKRPMNLFNRRLSDAAKVVERAEAQLGTWRAILADAARLGDSGVVEARRLKTIRGHAAQRLAWLKALVLMVERTKGTLYYELQTEEWSHGSPEAFDDTFFAAFHGAYRRLRGRLWGMRDRIPPAADEILKPTPGPEELGWEEFERLRAELPPVEPKTLPESLPR